jgi:long-chain acyl-CoA synthetase
MSRRYGVSVHQQYGSTETGMIAINLDSDGQTPTSVGRAIPGVTIRILDDDKRPVPPDRVGDVAVRSAYAARSYDGDAAGSDSYFEEGVFYPGDRGVLDGSGRLELRDRRRGFINVAGNKVDPGEVETLLRTHPAVVDAAVVGVPDGAGDEKVKAVVVLRSPATVMQMVDYCRSRMAAFKCPRVIQFRDEIPRNAMGKIVRADLLDG